MSTTDTLDDLVELARNAAVGVPGLGPVEEVKVAPYTDSEDKEAFRFFFLADRDPGQIGVTRIRLGMKVRDALLARGDDRTLMCRF